MKAIWVIEVAATGDRVEAWLQSADVDAHDGRGFAGFTRDRAKALEFTDAESAIAFWQQTSRVRPRREDGRWNRPLTGFTVEIK